ncbi:fumarylacetoacetate hydrolase family protein [Nocardiopsis sp. RSe5-2]|uniref:Fumarylacetoacetate hydrolase family protein n=1 Tax=Nocardiopsis endophytica TaxID=3018445 RepID=A0ABT4U5C2_9ACTN|nr:fumarylacetoacetate hydrolase family protein [Nocardiopsis endophytica]MDA2811911.1 fumarylacetoacetate hydrolase family protein [Nocardiopsis endophytica]
MDGFVRFTDHPSPAAGSAPRVGWYSADRGAVHPLPGTATMADLLRLPLPQIRALAERAARDPSPVPASDALLLPPVDGGTEVWASGVTYERSREARREESGSADLYERVYTAQRPELFFKAVPWRVVTDGEPVAVREDSALDVPEPELALVANAFGDVVGYGVCNDMSSRSIEGENALYLPQAKVYAGSCALAPVVRPAWLVPDWRALRVSMSVERGGATAFSGEIGLTAMRREPADLLSHLFAGQPFPDGAVLATGTGIVPDMDFTLEEGDVVHIGIEGVGGLSNPVVRGGAGLEWLVAARDDARARPPRRRG